MSKKSLIKMLTILSLVSVTTVSSVGVLNTTQQKPAKAAAFANLAGLLYLYRHRSDIEHLIQKGKRIAKTDGMPQFKVANMHNGNYSLIVQTNKGKRFVDNINPALAKAFMGGKTRLEQILHH